MQPQWNNLFMFLAYLLSSFLLCLPFSCRKSLACYNGISVSCGESCFKERREGSPVWLITKVAFDIFLVLSDVFYCQSKNGKVKIGMDLHLEQMEKGRCAFVGCYWWSGIGFVVSSWHTLMIWSLFVPLWDRQLFRGENEEACMAGPSMKSVCDLDSEGCGLHKGPGPFTKPFLGRQRRLCLCGLNRKQHQSWGNAVWSCYWLWC